MIVYLSPPPLEGSMTTFFTLSMPSKLVYPRSNICEQHQLGGPLGSSRMLQPVQADGAVHPCRKHARFGVIVLGVLDHSLNLARETRRKVLDHSFLERL